MSCSKQPGAKAFIGFVEAATGETLTQQDWHDVRKLAEGYGMGRSRITPTEAGRTLQDIKVLLQGENSGPTNSLTEMVFADAMAEVTRGPDGSTKAKVSQGTASGVRYLANKGVSETLAKVRASRKNESFDETPLEGEPTPQKLNFRYIQCSDCGEVTRVTGDRTIGEHGNCPCNGKKLRMSDDFSGYELDETEAKAAKDAEVEGLTPTGFWDIHGRW